MIQWLYHCAFVALLLLILSSCSQTQKSPVNEAQVPSDFGIVFGEGGGFAGLWQGYTIKPDGTVLGWQGRVAEQNPRVIGKLSRAQQLALWQQVQGLDYFTLDSQERSNMTAFMRVTAKGNTHAVSWLAGSKESGIASSLQKIYGFCHETVGQITKD